MAKEKWGEGSLQSGINRISNRGGEKKDKQINTNREGVRTPEQGSNE